MKSKCLHDAQREASKRFGMESVSLTYTYKMWVEKERGTLDVYIKEFLEYRLELTRDKIRLLIEREKALQRQLDKTHSL